MVDEHEDDDDGDDDDGGMNVVQIVDRCSSLCWCRTMMSLLAAHFLYSRASRKWKNKTKQTAALIGQEAGTTMWLFLCRRVSVCQLMNHVVLQQIIFIIAITKCL